MSKKTPLAGLEVVGRGIYLRPYQPYQLKKLLFEQQFSDLDFYSSETEQYYSVPSNYGINNSPPMPSGKALNQLTIEESWDKMSQQMGLSAKLALGNIPFSIDASSNRMEQMAATEDAFYALRTSFIPLWSVYLPEVKNYDFKIKIPAPFKHCHRREYEKFFETYGSHYVKRAWVGGKANLALSIAKSAQISKAEIQAGLKTSGFTQQHASMKAQESREKIQNNSECIVFGQGGDELKLAALNTLDEELYQQWLHSIKQNPQVIELEVAGIWTLIEDEEEALALAEAYKAATSFTPLTAILNIGEQIYFISGKKYFCYNIEKKVSEKPKSLLEKWPKLAQAKGFERIDAAFKGDDLIDNNNRPLDNKLFFFTQEYYLLYDIERDEIDDGYPKKISEGLNLPFKRLDAAVNAGRDALYFFYGHQYVRYNTQTQQVDAGYPESFNQRWAGVIFERIDAAIYWGNGKVYFFRDDQYIRYDMTIYQADAGYPRFISSSYVEDWKFFN